MLLSNEHGVREFKHNVREYSPLTLAFVGDSVYDMLVREYLVSCANRPVKELNIRKVKLVCCEAQAGFIRAIEDKLTEEEAAVFRRGKNASPHTVPKNSNRADYYYATGLEALFGYLYLDDRSERLRELFLLIIDISEKSQD